MAPPDPKRDDGRTLLRKAGTAACAFGIFVSGWMGMRTDDWRQIALWVVIAAGCAWFASRLAGGRR